MYINFSAADLKLLTVLLDRAGNEFSNHGCNDFHLIKDAGLTGEEVPALVAKMRETFPGDEIDEKVYQMDWLLFAFFEKRCRDALAERESEPETERKAQTLPSPP